MLSTLFSKVLDMALTKLGSLLFELVIDVIESKKDEKDIKDAFKEEDEGAIASGLNDVFTR